MPVVYDWERALNLDEVFEHACEALLEERLLHPSSDDTAADAVNGGIGETIVEDANREPWRPQTRRPRFEDRYLPVGKRELARRRRGWEGKDWAVFASEGLRTNDRLYACNLASTQAARGA